MNPNCIFIGRKEVNHSFERIEGTSKLTNFYDLIDLLFWEKDNKHLYSTIIYIMNYLDNMEYEGVLILDNYLPAHAFFMFGHISTRYKYSFVTYPKNNFNEPAIGLK